MKSLKTLRTSNPINEPLTQTSQFLIEFDQRYHKLKQHQTKISENLLGFKLMKATKLLSHHE